MFLSMFKKFFGSRNERLLKRYSGIVSEINNLEPKYSSLSDDSLKALTLEFKDRYQKGETLEDLLPEAFAVVRESAKRTLDMRHFDVQLIGGIVLHEGRIAEMRTGEGKTLVATLAAYLNALSGDSVHIITVNDYLATRDAAWMGKIYQHLGLETGAIVSNMQSEKKLSIYQKDIVYGTNNEFGFDYLRDNMAFRPEDRFQRDLGFAIVDEVDSILIDESRTPLIISGPTEESSELYIAINKLVSKLNVQKDEDGPGDYSVDEKTKQIHLTEEGHQSVEDLLINSGLIDSSASLYEASNIKFLHHITSALRANVLFQKDVDYIVQDGQIIIVDEFTGRTMPGRRWGDGLHQSIEAKENVSIENENQTLASITFQNYFRLYKKLSGMTGTADTEAYEFQEIYGLEVAVIPTHMEMIRDDKADLVYLTINEKFKAIVEDIKESVNKRQPVLVGTASIEASEHLSALLEKLGIAHSVLNAKHHQKESEIISNAGRPSTVTIATNMAGRGTDIVLGGNLEAELSSQEETEEQVIQNIKDDWQERHQKVVDAGGLHVIGTERHESRRIDNQLRGRSGRQGDPGSSRFYVSLEDNLMRIFASEKMTSLMQRIGMEEGDSIEHPLVTKAISNAQRKVEAHNFDIRKHLLEYDDVANDQRKVVYEQRKEIMDADNVHENVTSMKASVVDMMISQYIPENTNAHEWDIEGLEKDLESNFGLKITTGELQKIAEKDNLGLLQSVIEQNLDELFTTKEEEIGSENIRGIEKDLMLQVLDAHWKEHLIMMEHLRQGIGLRSYAQKNPKQEYKKEAFSLFQEMLDRIKQDFVTILAKIDLSPNDISTQPEKEPSAELEYHHKDAEDTLHPDKTATQPSEEKVPYVRKNKKIGRNEPCWCDSGKKYKHCHGK